MKVTEVGRRKNFLANEARLLNEGKHGNLTPEEWLYAYTQVVDDLLAGAQTDIFAGFEGRIRNQVVERAMDAVAL